MQSQLINHLACPQCAGMFSVEQGADAAGMVEEGTLICRGCSARYVVRSGVPRLLAPEAESLDATRKTRRVYNFTWRQFGDREVHDQWEKDSYAYSSLIPEGLLSGAGKIGLEAGCGGGADLLRLSAGGAMLIGFDLSEGVDVARRLTRGCRNVELVQGDLHNLPFKPGSLDFIYSFGVLHHLPDTQAAFVRLSRLLKPGAPLVTYLYEDRADRSWVDRALLGAVRAVRRVSSALPPRALHAACWAMMPAVWLLCSAPAGAVRRGWPDAAQRMPFSHTLRPRVLVADLYDRFAPPVESRFSERQVQELYARAGFEGVETRQYRGWVSWGFSPNHVA
jgi:SAM-dependent methyltransferase